MASATSRVTSPTFAVAFGGGGARGLAHIHVIEALDELGIRPVAIAGSWSVRLSGSGFHVNHIHPDGWMSSCYYVAVPEAVEDETAKQGWIKFGEPAINIALKDAIRRTIRPAPGRLVLFPSYTWHGTVPFHDGAARTTIAFDVVPAS